MTLIEPTTTRLKLRQWQASDREPFANLNADPEVMAYFPARLSRKESDRWVDQISAQIAERGWGLWAVELKHAGEFIGFVGIHIPSLDLPVSPCVEIGWRLAAKHWGQGYATEAARSALAVGFRTLQLEEIVSFTSKLNLRSQAVMQRIGMQRDPQEFEHPMVDAGDPLRSHCVYRLTRSRWAEL